MYRLKKVRILTLANTLALIQLAFGILSALVFILVKGNTELTMRINPNILTMTMPQIILLYPVSYVIAGFFMGFVGGYFYNLVVKLTGGIAIDLTEESDSKKPEKDKKK